MVVSSGQHLNSKMNAKSDTNKLSFDTVMITVPTKYKDLCCIVTRTLMINADETQKAAY